MADAKTSTAHEGSNRTTETHSEPTLVELQRAEIDRAIERLTNCSKDDFRSELFRSFHDFHQVITARMFGRDGKPDTTPGLPVRPWRFTDERLAKKIDKHYWAMVGLMLEAEPVRDESNAAPVRQLRARMDEPGFRGFGVKAVEASHG